MTGISNYHVWVLERKIGLTNLNRDAFVPNLRDHPLGMTKLLPVNQVEEEEEEEDMEFDLFG